MAIKTTTFTSTAAWGTSFTSPNNAQKTTASTTTYASGSVSNNANGRNIGNDFIFPADAFSAPEGMRVTRVTVVTARYSGNPSNTGFNLRGTFGGQTVTLLSNQTSGSASQYVQVRHDIPAQYWGAASVRIGAQFQRNGGNGIAVRLPYMFVEVEYSEPLAGLPIYIGGNRAQKIMCGGREVAAVYCGTQKIV